MRLRPLPTREETLSPIMGDCERTTRYRPGSGSFVNRFLTVSMWEAVDLQDCPRFAFATQKVTCRSCC